MIKVRELVSAFMSIKNDAADSMFDNFECDATTLDKHWKMQCCKDKISYTIASHYLGTISSFDIESSISYADALAPLFDMQIDGIKRLQFPADFNLTYNMLDHEMSKSLYEIITDTYRNMYKTIESLDDEKKDTSPSEMMDTMMNSGTKSS